MTATLTPTQQTILAYALEHHEGKVVWFPDAIKGGARKKVLDGLSKRALIEQDGTDWSVAAAGYVAMGRERPAPEPTQNSSEAEGSEPPTIEQTEASTSAKPHPRENSKQATVVQMLQRPEGATIAQICEVTGWQAHTVRGTFSGALKKKLDLTIVSDKVKGGERVYRIA